MRLSLEKGAYASCPVARGRKSGYALSKNISTKSPRNRRSLRSASPDFLWTLMAFADLMRLSLRERRTRGLVWHCVAGNPGSPDFLWTLMAFADLMRLSLRERRTRGLVWHCVAGNPGSLRSR